MTMRGRVENYSSHSPHDRVLLLDREHHLLQSVSLETNGQWESQLDSADTHWVIVQLLGERCAAAACPAADSQKIALPALVDVDLSFANPVPNALLWLDPVALTGFPNELLWTLRLLPDRVIKLHLVEFPLAAEPLQLQLQQGQYQLSGGRFSIRSAAIGGDTPILISYGVEQATGERLVATDGVLSVKIADSTSYQLVLSPVAS